MSERGADALARALNESPLHQTLVDWCGQLRLDDLRPFHRLGYNRARHLRLVWQVVTDGGVHVPIEVVAEAVLPAVPGVSSAHLQFTISARFCIPSHLPAQAAALHPDGIYSPGGSLAVRGLRRLVEAMLATLTDPAVVAALAGLAAIESIMVPQPASLDLLTGPPVTEILDMRGLTPVPDAGTSYGATLLTEPALDLRDQAERHQQVDDWLTELALDAGLTGMEDVLDRSTRSSCSVWPDALRR